MTLLELTDPLFQYVCRLNRLVRTAGGQDASKGNVNLSLVVSADLIRRDVLGYLEEMRSKAVAEPGLTDQFEKIENILRFFVDFTVRRTAVFPDWHDLSTDVGILTYEDLFWDLLDETLKDMRPQATDRLTIFYMCVALGFTGRLGGQPEMMRRKMKEMYARIHGHREDEARICEDAYRNVDTRDLIQPPGYKLVGIAVALVGLIIVLFIAYVYLYHASSNELNGYLESVLKSV